ncbi:LOW QUALITY PROTEIN: melanoma-associated antigen B10-like [Rhynchonycteris naso]
MPRGQKSKLRAREKRDQARREPKIQEGALATIPKEGEPPSSLSPGFRDDPKSSPATGTASNAPMPGGVCSTISTAAAVSNARPNEEGAMNEVEEKLSALYVEDIAVPSRRGPLDEEVIFLVHYLLHKYQSKDRITKADMLRNAIKVCKHQYPEILRRATEHLEMVFGLDLKEMDPNRNTYVLINKLELSCDSKEIRGVPVTGLLMNILGLIFLKDNCASQEDVWKILNVMGLEAGKIHFLFGEPKKILTDFVKEGYLVYNQVPNSDPPRFVFLWGPRAYAETSKMKVLEYWAKVHNTVPSAYLQYYQEALQDEEERIQARVRAKARVGATANACSKAQSSTEPFHRGPLDEKVLLFLYYLLYKYQVKELIRGENLRNVIWMYRNRFLIITRASEYLELVFGLAMKEVDPYQHIYILMNKVELGHDAMLSADGRVQTGLLITVLGVIFMNGNCATEEQIWEILNDGVYWRRRHFIFGELRKLTARGFVKEDYLEYYRVPDSDPPCFEFLWSPRAHAETSALEFCAKAHATGPTAFPFLYKKAVRDEEERAIRAIARARNAAAAGAGTPPWPRRASGPR